jgi:hypothetical protein
LSTAGNARACVPSARSNLEVHTITRETKWQIRANAFARRFISDAFAKCFANETPFCGLHCLRISSTIMTHRSGTGCPHEPGRHPGEHRRLQLIFITRHIPRNTVERTLHALHFERSRKHAAGSAIGGFARFAKRGGAFR